MPKKQKKNKEGRPTVMTKTVLLKLEQAFAIGATDREACIYADIGESTFYEYCKENKDFAERKEAIKRKPILKAKNIIADSLKKENVDTAKWYLERKAKDEFSQKIESDNTNTNLNVEITEDVLKNVQNLLGK